MPPPDSIRLLAFGPAAEWAGWTVREMEVAPGITLGALMAELERERAGAAPARSLRWVVNHRDADADFAIQAGDEIALLPRAPLPASDRPAPARQPIARLVRDPIDPAAAAREVETPDSGATAIFVGQVRYTTDSSGRPLKAAEFQAYEPMALAEMHRLCMEATQRQRVVKVVLVHRLGRLKVGDVFATAAVSAARRHDALAACRWLVDGLPHAPIYRRRIWSDGTVSWSFEP